jgi:hypothetical protein
MCHRWCLHFDVDCAASGRWTPGIRAALGFSDDRTMSRSQNRKFRYPYSPKPALAGHHGALSAHIQTCPEGWRWEVREDGLVIKREINTAMINGMDAARWYLGERLTPEERDNEGITTLVIQNDGKKNPTKARSKSEANVPPADAYTRRVPNF